MANQIPRVLVNCDPQAPTTENTKELRRMHRRLHPTAHGFKGSHGSHSHLNRPQAPMEYSKDKLTRYQAKGHRGRPYLGFGRTGGSADPGKAPSVPNFGGKILKEALWLKRIMNRNDNLY